MQRGSEDVLPYERANHRRTRENNARKQYEKTIHGFVAEPVIGRASARPVGCSMTSLQLTTYVRVLAARCARVVHELVPPKNRGRREGRVPTAPAAPCAIKKHRGRDHRCRRN